MRFNDVQPYPGTLAWSNIGPCPEISVFFSDLELWGTRDIKLSSSAWAALHVGAFLSPAQPLRTQPTMSPIPQSPKKTEISGADAHQFCCKSEYTTGGIFRNFLMEI